MRTRGGRTSASGYNPFGRERPPPRPWTVFLLSRFPKAARRLFLSLLLTAPVWADLPRARQYLDQHRYGPAWREARRCRQEDPAGSELLQIWALAHDLREAEAYRRLLAFRPTPASSRLYLLVHSQLLGSRLDPEGRQKDLNHALELSHTPSQRVEVLLQLYSATAYPEDQKYWLEAAELAAQHPLGEPLMAQLSLTHIQCLKSQGRLAEAWYDLSQAQGHLAHDPTGPSQLEWARAEILEGLGRTSEAAEARWQAAALHPDPLEQLELLQPISARRMDFSKSYGQRLLDLLQRLQPRLSDPLHRLYAFHLRSIVCQETQLGRSAWLREAQTLLEQKDPSVCLLVLGDRGQLHMRRREFPAARADLQQALELGLDHPPHPRSQLYAYARPTTVALSLAAMDTPEGDFVAAERHALQGLQATEPGHDYSLRLSARSLLLQIYLKTARLEQAHQVVAELFQEAERMPSRQLQVTSYAQVFNTLLLTDLHPTHFFALAPLRVDRDTPAGWLFEQIRNDPEMLQRLFTALDGWGQQANTPQSRGVVALYRGLVLACLDRPLEAIDVYKQGVEAAEGDPAVQANLGLLLCHELLGQSRQAEALAVMRQAFERVQKAGSLAFPTRYRIALISLLIQQHREAEALQLTGLDPSEADYPLVLFLRARAGHNLEELKKVLALSQDPSLRQEVYFELARWQPQGDWLQQISDRNPKVALRVAQAYLRQERKPSAYEVCQQALLQFQEQFQQLPASAQPQAAASPTLRALVELALELKPEQGARWLSLWNSLQRQPAPTSQELEQLRAQLTGLRQSSDPRLQSRVADTRAQFLVALNQVRQLHPEAESTLSAQGSELLALQPHLDDHTLLLQYYVAPEAIYIQSLTHRGQHLDSLRVEKARLLQHLQRWLAALRSPAPLSAEALEANHQLYSLLLASVAPLREDHPNLLIMPSGPLWSLPWETLQDEQGRYLVESSSVTYLGPSDALQRSQPLDPRPIGDWLALGNPDLPGSQRELERIQQVFAPLQILSGPQASWAQLQKRAGQAQVVHIATHSHARPGQPNESDLQLADGKVPLRSIYQLKLAPGSLVVLSSCSSAVGQQHVERDLISLSNGFRSAGASSVIAALWPIDDEATAHFFPDFYAHLLQGQSRAVSLQRAKQTMLQSAWSHPFYWGAFTLLGEGR